MHSLFRGCAAPRNPSPESPPPDKVPQTSLNKCTRRRFAAQAHDSSVCSHLDLFSSQIPQQDFKDLWPSRKCKEREKLLFVYELFSFKAVPRRFTWCYSNFVYCAWYGQNRSWRDVCCRANLGITRTPVSSGFEQDTWSARVFSFRNRNDGSGCLERSQRFWAAPRCVPRALLVASSSTASCRDRGTGRLPVVLEEKKGLEVFLT